LQRTFRRAGGVYRARRLRSPVCDRAARKSAGRLGSRSASNVLDEPDMANPDFVSIPTEQLAEVGGGTRMCTSGTSDDGLNSTVMQMMQMMQSSLSTLGQNNNNSSSSMMPMAMAMMMKNRQS
jgi:hypothetical protein